MNTVGKEFCNGNQQNINEYKRRYSKNAEIKKKWLLLSAKINRNQKEGLTPKTYKKTNIP